MEEATPRKDSWTFPSSTISLFIKNPLDKNVNPRHIISIALEKRRAKSLLKRIDKFYQTEPAPTPQQNTPFGALVRVMPIQEIISEMKKKGYIDKKLNKILSKALYSGTSISDGQRKELWFYASGARNKKQASSRDYYYKILNELKICIEHFSNMIEKDLTRTFPDKTFDPDDKLIQKMRNVLNCYAKRNPSVGYCQGMNFIAARIIEIIDDEENSFWVLCALLEDLLPIDYFSSMLGILIDQRIFSEMVYRHDKVIARKFMDLVVDPSLFSLQWFVCCYVSTFSSPLCHALWDILLLEGSRALFKAGLVFLSYLKPKILEVQEFNQIFGVMDGSCGFYTDPKEFIKKMQQVYISKRLLNLMRNRYKEIIDEELEHIERSKKKKPQQVDTKELMSCRMEWPVCIDVMQKSKSIKKNSSTITFRVQNITESHKNYFTSDARNMPRIQGRQKHKSLGTFFDKEKTPSKRTEIKVEEKVPQEPDSAEKSNEFLKEFTTRTPKSTGAEKNLLIGRHNHTCRDSIRKQEDREKRSMLSIQRYKTDLIEEEDEQPEENLRKSFSPNLKKSVVAKPLSRQRAQSRASILSKPPDNKESAFETFFKNLLGIKSTSSGTEAIKPMSVTSLESDRIPSPPPSNKDDICYSTPETSPKLEPLTMNPDEDVDEDEMIRKTSRKTIYNMIIDSSDITGNANTSSQKSAAFMQEFFNKRKVCV